jgi:hypothetical protein
MRRSLAVALFAAMTLVAACHKNQAQNAQNAADMSVIDNNLTAPPADVETLPPDESAGTGNQATNDDLDANEENDVD